MKKVTAICLFAIFCSLCCYARHDEQGRDGSITVAQKIGSTDYQQFGKLIVEKRDGRFFMTIPFFVYNDDSPEASAANDYMPKDMPLYVSLSNGKVIQSKADSNTDFSLHYLWVRTIDGNDETPRSYYTLGRLYTWHSVNQAPLIYHKERYDITGGTGWLVRFEFTRADMAAMRRAGIVHMHAKRGEEIVEVPMKKKQAKQLRKKIQALMRK